MANRFWVGGNSTWDATAGTKWALTTGGAGGQAVPTSSDDVFLDNGTGTGNVTISATSNAKSLTCTGYVGTLTFNAGLTVAGAVTFVSGMTIAGTGGSLTCNTTASHTSAGKTLTCPLTLNGTATHTLADNWTVSGLVTLGGTTLTTTVNSNTLNCAAGLTTGGSTAIVTGTTTIKLTGTGTWQGPSSTGALRNNLTIDASGATVTLSGTTRYNTGTLTYTAGTLAGASTPVLSIAVATTITGFSGSTAATGQMQWDVTISASVTITLGSNLKMTGTFTESAGACTFSGAFNITCGGWTISGSTTGTTTLTGTVTSTGALTLSNTTSTTFSGNFNITSATAVISGTQTITIVHDVTITDTTTISDACVINGAFIWNTVILDLTGALSGTTTINFNGSSGTHGWDGPAALSNNVTINVTGGTFLFGYDTGTPLYNTGTITWVSGSMSTGAGGVLRPNGSCTLDLGGSSFPGLLITAAATITLSSLLYIPSGSLTLPDANVTFAGTAGWTVQTLTNTSYTATRTVTFTAALTYTIQSQFLNVGTTAAIRQVFTASNTFNLILSPGATQDIGFLDPTSCTSSGGQQIVDYRGTLTSTNNWTTTIPPIRPMHRPTMSASL